MPSQHFITSTETMNFELFTTDLVYRIIHYLPAFVDGKDSWIL